MTAPTPPAATPRGSGNIYDLGYQGYDGPRLGRLPVTRSLLAMTLRAAYGIGRGGRAKIAPFTLLVLNTLPALLAVGIAALAAQAGAGGELAGASPIRHETYQGLTSTLVMLFCAAQAPELFGRDQRYGVLPLYFSRVLTRSDYAIARTGGLFLAILVISIVPQLVLTAGGIVAAPDPVTGFRDELEAIPRYLAVTVLAAALLGGVAAVISAWTPRRAYATATIIAVFIVPPIIVQIVATRSLGDVSRILLLASPADLIDGLNAAIFGTLPDSPAVLAADLPGWAFAVAVLAGSALCVAAVLRRYQRIDA
jgi:ABC-2 type transport system permease protein